MPIHMEEHLYIYSSELILNIRILTLHNHRENLEIFAWARLVCFSSD